MTPGERSIAAITGVQKLLTFFWKAGPVAGPHVAVDTTGYSARLVVARQDTKAKVIELTTQGGTIVLTPATGKIEATFSRAAMAVQPGEHFYFLVLTSPAGRDYPLLTGRFPVAVNGVPS